MQGLIEKDLRLTLVRKQNLLIFFVMALIMSVSMDGSFIISYLTVLATIVAIGTISYDEFDNGFAFLMTLPFDRKTYVREKYLFSLIMAVVAWCIGTVLYFIGNVIRQKVISPADELPMLIALIPVLFLSAAFMIPLQLKYGSEKSKTVLFVIFGFFMILIVGAQTVFKNLGNPFKTLSDTLDGLSPFVILTALTAICALITFICYLWTVRIMENKEF